jgi:hypothetical protein
MSAFIDSGHDRGWWFLAGLSYTRPFGLSLAQGPLHTQTHRYERKYSLVKKEEINDWLQLLGIIGVIISLIFVGLQIKQSGDIATADIYQQRSAMWIDIALSKYSPEQYEAVITKRGSENSTLTEADIAVLGNLAAARFTYYENIHFQYQLGMINEEEWRATQRVISSDFLKPCLSSYWRETKRYWRESFVSDIDTLQQQLDIPTCDIPDL